MVMCFAPDCKHYSERDRCRFFVFPKDVKEKKIWCKLLRREDREPSKYSLVCSCHFLNGDRNNRPTIYQHNKEKLFKAIPEEKKRRYKSPLKKTSSNPEQTQVPAEQQLSGITPSSKVVPVNENICMPSTSSVARDSSDHISLCIDFDESSSATSSSIHTPSTSQQIYMPSTSAVARDSSDHISICIDFDESSSATSSSIHTPSTSQQIELPGTRKLVENLNALEISSAHRFVSMVEAENYFLSQQVRQQEEKLNRLAVTFSWEHIENDNTRILMYTGIPNKEIFMALFNLMNTFELKYYNGWSVIGVSKINQLLLTLMKLRLNLHHEDLACRFNITRTTISNIIYTWIHALHEVIYEQLMEEIPSRSKNKLCAPSSFISFTNCRIIIDCTEIYVATPKNMEKQQLTYSSYKHRNTLKGLVGVAPNGVCTFISKLYPGSTSDKKLFGHCGLSDKLVPGDLVIADKGFLIANMLPEGVLLNIPPFLTTPQFTEAQVLQTQKIARARIHVERAIRRIKCYDILNNIPSSLIPQSSFIFQVCGALTNFQFPLIKEVEDLFCKNEY